MVLLCVIDSYPNGTIRQLCPPPHELEFTHIVAGAVHIVPTVHGDVQRMHLGPAIRRARLGEVTWRAGAEVRTPACFSSQEEMREGLSISSSLRNHQQPQCVLRDSTVKILIIPAASVDARKLCS